MPYRPMLAAKIDNVSQLRLPSLASPKVDGIRCLRVGGRSVSRKFLDIPNLHIQQAMSTLPDGLDGELWWPGAGFHAIQSAVMSRSGNPNFQYHVFDFCPDGCEEEPFETRVARYHQIVERLDIEWLIALPQTYILDANSFQRYVDECLECGHEGACFRLPSGPYKNGRSTIRENYLLKYKQFQDDEAVVLDFEEMYHNENEKQLDDLGYTKRSHSLEGKVASGTLGKLVVRDVKTGSVFRVGSGFTLAQRHEIWKNQSRYVGQTITYRHQPYGAKDLPRIGVFKGFRFD